MMYLFLKKNIQKLITNTKLLEKPKNRGNLRLYSLKNEVKKYQVIYRVQLKPGLKEE